MEAQEEAPWVNPTQGSQDLSTGRCTEATPERLTLIKEVTVLLEEAIWTTTTRAWTLPQLLHLLTKSMELDRHM